MKKQLKKDYRDQQRSMVELEMGPRRSTSCEVLDFLWDEPAALMDVYWMRTETALGPFWWRKGVSVVSKF